MNNKPEKPKFPDDRKEEPGLPMRIPMSVIRWLVYSFCFFWLLLPFWVNDSAKKACAALILGWFAGQLNALINKYNLGQ